MNRKIQFGCGGNILPGWENYDMEVDITKPLPFGDGVASHIFAEHVVEHITIHQAWNFFEECYRILQPNGEIQIAVPSASQIYEMGNENYFKFIEKHGWGQANRKDAVKSIIFNHEHKTIWEWKSLEAILTVIGFKECYPSEEMKNLRSHHKVIGKEFDSIETITFHGIKI